MGGAKVEQEDPGVLFGVSVPELMVGEAASGTCETDFTPLSVSGLLIRPSTLVVTAALF